MNKEMNIFAINDSKLAPERINQIRAIMEKEGRLNAHGGVNLTQKEKEFLKKTSSWVKSFSERAEQYGNLSINQYAYLYEEMLPQIQSTRKIGEVQLKQYLENSIKKISEFVDIFNNGYLKHGTFLEREVILLLVEPREYEGKKYSYIEAVDAEFGVIYSGYMKDHHIDVKIPYVQLNEFIGEHLYIRGKTPDMRSEWGELPFIYYSGRYGYGKYVHKLEYQKIKLNFTRKNDALLTPATFKAMRFKATDSKELMEKSIIECQKQIKSAIAGYDYWKGIREQREKENAITKTPFSSYYEDEPKKMMDRETHLKQTALARMERINAYLKDHPQYRPTNEFMANLTTIQANADHFL